MSQTEYTIKEGEVLEITQSNDDDSGYIVQIITTPVQEGSNIIEFN